MPGSHAKLSPSSAKRWMTCPGSVKLIEQVEEKFGEEGDSEYAALGTALHEAAEWCLHNQETPEAAVGRTFYDHEVVEDDIDRYADYVHLVNSLPGSTYYEQKVTVIDGIVWGTSDTINVDDTKLTVIDLKTGYNRVDAEDNPQLLMYALGAYMAYGKIYDITEIEMIVSQPVIGHESSWTIGVNQLNEFYAEVVESIENIKLKPDHLVPSDGACQWCRARGTCSALRTLVRNEARKDFERMDLLALAEAVSMLPMLEHYISGVKARSQETLQRGEKVPGFKLVEGRKSRAWISEEGIMKYLSRKIPKFKLNAFNHKLKSPSQIEKEIKKQGDAMFRPVPKLNEFIESRPGKPTVVPVEDKRPELVAGQSAAADFADVAEPEGS